MTTQKEFIYDVNKKRWWEIVRGVKVEESGTGTIDVTLTMESNIINCDPTPASGTITNTGPVTLTNVTLTSYYEGPITLTQTTLAPGESVDFDYLVTGRTDPNTDSVTATGDYVGGTATDTANASAQWICD